VIKACPTHAISYVDDVSEPLGGKIIIDKDLCDLCGICVAECCRKAIEIMLA
jgi:ferredoxin